MPFYVHDSSGDAVTGLADGDFTKRISKNGATFGAMTTSIAEMENGWYSTTLSTGHTDTNGLLTIVFTHASSKQVNRQFRVTTRINDDYTFPTTPGRSLDVNADGTCDPNFDNASGTIDASTQIDNLNDPAVGEIADAVWDEAAGDHTTSTSFGDLAVAVAAIEADTDELQTDLADGGRVDTIFDSILADTAELQTDWADGGRLDLLQDAIKTVTDGLHNFDYTSEEITMATNNDKTGYQLAAAGVDSIWDEVVENSKTARNYLRFIKAACAGKSTGGGTSTNNYRNDADSQNTIAATVDSDGNRTAVTLTP